LLDADGEGMVDEPSNVLEGGIGHDDRCLRRLPVKKVVALVNVVADDAITGLFERGDEPSVPGARLPYRRGFSQFHVKQYRVDYALGRGVKVVFDALHMG